MIAASVKQPNQLPDQVRDTDPWTTAVVAVALRYRRKPAEATIAWGASRP